jgi:peptidyl-prolyl cis-trans isomerase C
VPFGPVKTASGWNVGEVTRVSPAAPAVYATAKTALKSQMLVAAQLVVWRGWLGRQITSAHVRYAAKYRPSKPNSAPTTGPGQVNLPAAAATTGSK